VLTEKQSKNSATMLKTILPSLPREVKKLKISTSLHVNPSHTATERHLPRWITHCHQTLNVSQPGKLVLDLPIVKWWN